LVLLYEYITMHGPLNIKSNNKYSNCSELTFRVMQYKLCTGWKELLAQATHRVIRAAHFTISTVHFLLKGKSTRLRYKCPGTFSFRHTHHSQMGTHSYQWHLPRR